MPHANAPLAELGRLRLALCIVEDGWPVRVAAERFQVSHTTAARWAARYRAEGAAGMVDRSSRPRRSPTQTRPPVVRKIKHLRTIKKLGAAQIAGRLGLAASTVHKVLRREGMARLAHLDRASGQPVRRYERDRPGELVHVDVKKLGRIPDGGGWRAHGRVIGKRHSNAAKRLGIRLGYCYLHTMLDDHSRLAYTEILASEDGPTCAAFLARALDWFAAHGVTVERVLTDNAKAYLGKHSQQLLADRAIKHKRTRPYRPQTNGKVERFHRTLLDEWAYTRPWRSDRARRAALPSWLHFYNHHRPHTALGRRPPASRVVTNLCGQNT